MAKIKCSPTCARLIVINHKKQTFSVVPGGKLSKWITVPEEVLSMPFVESLVDNGVLIAGTGVAAEKTEQEELDILRAQCKELGIRYNGKHKVEKLKELLEEHALNEDA